MKTLSLFSGCGGLDIGAEMAGAQVVCCVDNDQDSLDSIALNDDGSKTLLNEDISQLDGQSILEASGLAAAHMDQLDRGDVTKAEVEEARRAIDAKVFEVSRRGGF